MIYGTTPEVIGNYQLEVHEMMLYLYMPISMPSHYECAFPLRLKPFAEVIWESMNHETRLGNHFDYWYVTAKHRYVTPDSMNRPGWHCDGFMTDDVNYIWSDCVPTEFAFQYLELTQDDAISMQEMEDQIKAENIRTYEAGDLLRLTQEHVHRVPVCDYSGMRTFFKLTGSNSKFDLKGNTHNYLIDYDWPMRERKEDRNMESESTAASK